MKKISSFKNKFTLILYVIFVIFQVSGCDEFGAIPKDNDYLRMKESPNYNISEDKFLNQNSEIIKEMKKNSGFWANPRKNMANNFFFNGLVNFMK